MLSLTRCVDDADERLTEGALGRKRLRPSSDAEWSPDIQCELHLRHAPYPASIVAESFRKTPENREWPG